MFTVPIVSTDLRHDETIIQAARALDCLKVTIDSVFDRIDGRIATNVQKLANLGARISSAEERIRSFQGVKTAIKIYAPSRFPASHVFEDLPATFDICNEPMKPLPAEDPERLIRLPTKLTAKESAEAMQNKLVFYHVRDEVPDTAVRSVCSPISEHIAAAHARLNRHGNSLGKPPEHLLSAASLLRFNSEELAYSSCAADEQSSKAKEAWRRAKMYRNQRRETAAVQRKQHYNLEPAPHSIAHGHHMRATRSGELRYTPRMNEAPSFELPMDLPTLQGIATDIQFEASADMYSNITPSSPATTLPVIEATQPIVVESELKPKETKAPAQKKRTAPQPPAAEAVAPAIAVATTPPPPPPPPPARAPAIQPSSPPSTSSGDDTRSALMDAIRKAGGTRGGGLRSAAAAPLDVTDVNKQVNKRESKQPTGGNLMADLHNKLLMRRKGISGINSDASINSTSSNFNMNMEDTNVNVRRKKDTSMGSSVMDRLSALIPPPPPKTKVEEQKQQQKERNQHSDDNTEEDDDWN